MVIMVARAFQINIRREPLSSRLHHMWKLGSTLKIYILLAAAARFEPRISSRQCAPTCSDGRRKSTGNSPYEIVITYFEM